MIPRKEQKRNKDRERERECEGKCTTTLALYNTFIFQKKNGLGWQKGREREKKKFAEQNKTKFKIRQDGKKNFVAARNRRT